jgi:hypothetical protein
MPRRGQTPMKKKCLVMTTAKFLLRDVGDNKLQPFIAPVNHNTLTSAKAFQIVHTLMGNFCHRDKGKISQMEEMGNNACVLMGYHDKVCFANLVQITHIMNNLFHHLTLFLFIYRKAPLPEE